MQFDLVSPERSLASFAANSVQIPGMDGDMTVMQGHAPTITTLRPGLMHVDAGGQAHEYVVTGGFAEIGAAGVSVLAEKAIVRSDVTQADIDALAAAAKETLEKAQNGIGDVDVASKTVADISAMASALGLSA